MRPRRLIFAAYAAASLLTAAVLGVASLTELFRYSPYENPGAGQAGLRLGIAAVTVAAVPAAVMIILIIRALARDYRRLTAGLTPAQRLALAMAESAGMAVAHELWKRHNDEESSRLTASVMGEPRGEDQAE